MKIFTFCGNCAHIQETQYDYVVVDQTYYCNLPKDAHDIIWNVTQSDDRQTRIALNLLKALNFISHLPDDIFAIIDSDVVVPNIHAIDGHQMLRTYVFTLCYPLFYDWAGEIRPFCSGTNFVFTRGFATDIQNTIRDWMIADPKTRDKIDIYIHNHLRHINVFIPPVSHYIKGRKVTYYGNDYDIILRHIPEFTLFI
ncbi:hypothetical protein ARV1_gp32 [Acidianus rod-shaped virus 1]|uniref:Nucleotide-diphospho-sugar transferase domain-containing protein n=1 Tax=Acidianus rod-shaped virus 1 TaxID=309181 RepID=Q50I39_9VIRU|nr:hypothetical protein ARV1_gp32 [Acidianus rod-shaped virus 1]CAI44187.1 hypothetical protein [Acidianus rod-shaped virus 1]